MPLRSLPNEGHIFALKPAPPRAQAPLQAPPTGIRNPSIPSTLRSMGSPIGDALKDNTREISKMKEGMTKMKRESRESQRR
jgi:hypothetical protein